MNPIDPESLIYRFAKQLEFGQATMAVAGEAVRIIQRMNRDWMTTGRRPAGLCGAALILAARMNNFRRTVREVVYVVKVTEITISQRLNEFSSTESGELTVDQFRSVQLENTHDPPSFTRGREGGRQSRIKRKVPETAAEIEDDLTESEAGSVPPPRLDADGFAIPNLPIDPALTARRSSIAARAVADAAEELKTEVTNSKGKKRQPAPEPPADEIASEEALEDEMRTMLAQGSNMVESATEPERPPVSDNTEIDAAEFEDDPEVANCLLLPAEVEIKESIWVTENKEYLRTQQAKALKRAMEESEGGTTSRKPRKRRRGRLGDVTYLEGEGEEGRSRASTPAEATRRMLERRGYSKKINYSLLDTLYGGEGTDAKAESMSRSQSRSQSVISRRSASIEPQAAPRRATPSDAKPVLPPSTTAVPLPTPPTTQNTQEPIKEDGSAPANPDPDDQDDYDDDDGEEDGVDDAFAGHYGDHESDYESDYDYGDD
jgi:transcription factor IIIB subunit 2